jgi:hypothetical protein
MDKDSDKKLNAILDAIKGLENRVAKIEASTVGAGNGQTTSRASAKKLSIREFLLGHPPMNDVQRTLAVGHFLEIHEGMSSFTRADLEQGYRDAKHGLPSNMSMNIKHCIASGNMMEAKEKKNNKPAYVVTGTGEDFVKNGYNKPSGK